MYPKSLITYITILFVCMVFAICASNNKTKNSEFNIWVGLIILVLSIFAGVRGESVGIDVQHYIVKHIEPIRYGLFSSVNQPIGFKILVWLVYRFTEQTYMVFMVFGFITNYLIIKRLWDFRNKASFPLMILFYYCYFYLITFNVFRQFISIAIIFYATKYLENKKYFKYCIGLLIAISIHSTSILGLLILVTDILLSKSNIKERNIKIIFTIISPILMLILAILLYKYYDFEHYYNLYLRYNNGSVPFMTIVKILVSLVMYFVLINDYYIKEKITITSAELKKIFVIYLIGLFIALSVILSSFADRFAWYFLIWEPVFMALKIKNKNLKLIMQSTYILFALYTFYVSVKYSGQGIMPYVTIWQ